MKKYVFLEFALLSATLLFTSCNNRGTVVNNNDCQDTSKVRNVILMIGDGMSLPQVYAAMMTSENTTSFERFPVTGISITKSFNKEITDSAAGGTAIATGVKTNNGMIGVSADSIGVPSILGVLAEKGKKTGIVVTSSITHATPASFLAKNINRNNNEEIAMDIANNEHLNIIVGGGRKYFETRKDSINLFDKMTSEGWKIFDYLPEGYSDDKIAVITSKKHMESAKIRGDILPQSVDFALKSLSNDDNGFFLMVEGSQIDFAAHDNDSVTMIEELRDFDEAINIALDFAENNANTLVIVTADHETGGLTMIDPNGKYTATDFHWTTKSHSALPVPVFAFGSGAENFSGIMDNTDIMKRILKLIE